MKSLIKSFINKNSHMGVINFIFFQRKYHFLGFGLVLINIIFQRVFRINSNCKWQIHFTSRVSHPQRIKIYHFHDNSPTFLSFSSSGGCYMQANNGIEIHKGVTWSYGVHFISANHSFKDYLSHMHAEPIKIFENAWIGANSVILPGVQIGKYAIVGAGSIVTKNIPAYSICVGNPSKVVGYRCKSCLDKLEKIENEYVCSHCDKIYRIKDFI